MKEVNADRSTRMSLPSATSTWRSAAKQGRGPVQIAVGHLEKEVQLENALDEYCQLREQDRSLTASRFCERYPSYRHSLRRLIDVHDAMEGQPGLEEENWPELFSEFLGYEIVHELGVGAIARVYLATEAALGGRLVAIKVAQEGGDEAETLGKLTHPNIVPVFSVKHDEETDLTAVCMPYHGSATLADLLEIGFQDGTAPTTSRVILDAAREREQIVDFVESITGGRSVDRVLLRGNYVDGVVRLGIQMADALAYTHERGILHRDLKPSNVLLTPDGVPMLLDFNLASDIETGAQRLGGTLPYMPPEQIRDVHLQPFEAELECDARSDIFSLGVILYELLTGKLPFGDPPACISPQKAAAAYLIAQKRTPTPVTKLNSKVSPSLAKTIDRCLALDETQRPPTAAQLARELSRHFGWPAQLKRHRAWLLVLIAFSMLVATYQIHASLDRVSDYVRHMKLAITFLENGQYSEAINHFDRAEEVDGDATLPILFGRGYCYEQEEMLPIALAELQRAAELSNDPLIIDCCAHLAVINVDYPKAIYFYQQSARLDPTCTMRYVSLAYCKLNNKPDKPSLAIRDLTIALGQEPNLQIAFHLRANGYLQSRHQKHYPIEEAIADIEAAFRVGPAYAQLHCDAARVYAMAAVDEPRFLEETKAHLAAAVKAGLPRSYLEQREEFESWKDREWFWATLDQGGKNGLSQPPTSLRTQSLLKCDPQEVADWLRKYTSR